jgi:DNA repair protein RecN (Recombination protein N)
VVFPQALIVMLLTELRVAQLGVIEDLTVVLGPGMTVLTGETGAGKTLIVDAISLLRGARADATLVRPGAPEAIVEGRFVGARSDEELVLLRTIPASGRGRAYVDGRMASAPQLAEWGEHLVDLHGQHAHQSLLRPAAQRAALDTAAGISTEEVALAKRHLRELMAVQAALGGDPRARARELDLVRYQLTELDAAALESESEDAELREEEEWLSDAAALREAAASVADSLTADEGIVDRLGSLVAQLSGRAPLTGLHYRLLGLQTELADVASEGRAAAELFEDNPARLAEIGARRQLLTELRRKYGATLQDVIDFREHARDRLTELEAHDDRARQLEGELVAARAALAGAEDQLGEARRAAAARFASDVETALRSLAMPRARFAIEVGPDRAGDSVTWLLGANPGEPLLPLAKVASGGELARAMLAVRLVLTERRKPAGDQGMRRPSTVKGTGGLGGGREASSAADGQVGPVAVAVPDGSPTLIFDEVDAGIGGEAAVAVGQALAALGREHQVLVVTHLPQVAAFADRHLVVRKQTAGKRTRATVEEVDGETRVIELSRLLSGRPDSPTARRHAEELLAQRPTSRRRR